MEERKVLYLGTDPSNYPTSAEVIHYPVIRIVPRDFTSFAMKHQVEDLYHYTHLILTSKNAVKVLMDLFAFYDISPSMWCKKEWICIGTSTEKVLRQFGVTGIMVSQEETQEGVIKLLDLLDLRKCYLFYPRSATARPTLSCYLKVRQLRHQICELYDTVTFIPSSLPVLEDFDEVVFTSPSTVKAFFELFLEVPATLKMVSIGSITKEFLKNFNNKLQIEEKCQLQKNLK